MFVYHFADPDLRVQIFFEKEGAAENGGADFEIGDLGTSQHFYWRLKTEVQDWGKDTNQGYCWCVYKLWGKGFSVFLGGTGMGLVVNYLNIKFRSKFNHGFTNRDCLHCAILKALYGFKEKMSPQGKRYVIFSSKCSK